MATVHHGNMLNEITFEEHDGTLNAKKVSLISGATIYAVVNTSAAGDSVLNIGFATVSVSNPTLYAVVNTTASSGFATVDIRNTINANVSLGSSAQFIGIVTVANASLPVTFSGNVTLDDGSLTGIIGNVTLSDSKGYIGLTTATLGTGLSNIGFATVSVSNPTLYAVVNTTASSGFATVDIRNTVATTFSGNVTLDAGSKTQIVGNVTISDSKGFIGLTTTTLGASPAFVGIVTVANASFPVTQSGTWDEVGINDSGNSITVDNNGTFAVQSTFAGNVTLDDGSLTGIVGNVTLSDSKGYIGLTTSTLGASTAGIGFATVNVAAIAAGDNNVGNVDVASIAAGDNNIGNVDLASAIPTGANLIGIVTIANSSLPVTFSGNVTLDDGSLTGIVGNVTLSDSKTYIGLVTVGGIGTVTLADPKGFIGLVTAVSRNAGTTKTLIHKNIELSTSSIATIAVATGGNAIFYVTQNVISSDATVRVSIKSGATYLTGNASIGITLNPGGGWVENGSPDSPTYIGLASGAAIVIEKFDMTATSAKVGGKVIYYQE